MKLSNETDYEFEEKDLVRLGAGIAQVALQIFEHCASGRDFAVQFMGSDCSVFGSTNRITWRPESGWSYSRAHCSPDFIKNFEELNLHSIAVDDIEI